MPANSTGGAERMAFDIVDAISGNFSVTLLFFLKGPGHSIPTGKNIRVEYLLGHKKRNTFDSIKLLFKLIDICRRHDIVIAGLELSTTYFSIAAARMARRPATALSHTELLKWMKRDNHPDVHRFLSRIAYHLADRVVSVSETVSDHLYWNFKVQKEKQRVIHNPLDIKRLKKLSRETPGWLPNGGRIIVALGRLSPEKGFDILIQAAGQMVSKKLHLVICGDGPWRYELERLTKNQGNGIHIHFPGFLNNPYPLLNRAEVFAFPSRSEGFGIALAEAMALGVPAVASRLPATEELTENGSCALLVDIENPRALAKGLDQILSDTGLRKKFIANGLGRAEDFALSKISEEWKALIQEVCG